MSEYVNESNTHRTNTVQRDPVAGIFYMLFSIVAVYLVILLPLSFFLVNYFFEDTLIGTLKGHWNYIVENYSLAFEGYKHTFALMDLKTKVGFLLTLTVPFILSCLFSYKVIKDQIININPNTITQGVGLVNNHIKFYKLLCKKMRKNKGAIFHPKGLRLSKDYEANHMMYFATTGGGKSNAMQHVINSAIERKGKLIIFDVKGDFVSKYISPNKEVNMDNKMFLINPFDSRSIQWDISKDCVDKITCKTFAETFLMAGSETSGKDFFSKSGAGVFSGILLYLSIKFGYGKWGWTDVYDIMKEPQLAYNCLLEINHHQATNIKVDDDGTISGQTQGVAGTIATDLLDLVSVIKDYWPNAGGVSLASFVNDKFKTGTLILASKQDKATVTLPLISAMYALIMNSTLALEDNDDRDIWCFIDELPALPKINGVGGESALMCLVRQARSKGVRLVLGLQEFGALAKKYGKEEATAIAAGMGTKFIGKLGEEETAKFALGCIGEIKSERQQISTSENTTGGRPLANKTWVSETGHTLVTSELINLPKSTKKNGGFYMYSILADDMGESLIGKLWFDYTGAAKKYPDFIDAKISTCSATGTGTNNSDNSGHTIFIKQPKQITATTNSIKQLETVTEENKVIDAKMMLADMDAQIDLDSEQAEGGIETQIGAEVIDSILPGLGLAAEVFECIENEQQIQPSISTTTAKDRKKKKRDTII